MALARNLDIVKRAGWAITASPDAEAALLIVERRLGHRLPNSPREILCLERGLDLLAHFSNADRPIPLSELGKPIPGCFDVDPLPRISCPS